MGLIDGRVVLVTGASRGIGRGIAHELGAQGATVVVTARTMTADQAPRLSPGLAAIPGTLAETVELVQSTGAQVLALPADLANDEHVRTLIAEVIRRYGRIDVLVNSAMGLTRLGGVFWEMSLDSWDAMHTVGPRCAFMTAYFAAPHMIRQRHGLIVNVSSSGAKRNTHHGVPYWVAKAATDRLSQGLAHDLQPHSVAAVSLWPGAARTERLELAARGSAAAAGFALPPGIDLAKDANSPELSGRAIAHLSADPNVMARTGQALILAELAQEYGFVDIDGSVPKLSAGQRIARGIA